MSKVYKHWEDFPEAEWRWPNFTPQEMASKGEGELLIHEESMDALQRLRDMLGRPMLVTSAYRSPTHNRSVGGAAKSQHLLGRAFDIRMDNHNPAAFEEAAKACGFTSFGHYPNSGFMHIDTREKPARWNQGGWFAPVADDGLAVETETARNAPEKAEADGVAAGFGGGAAVMVTALAAGGADILGGLGENAQIVAIVGGFVVATVALYVFRGALKRLLGGAG